MFVIWTPVGFVTTSCVVTTSLASGVVATTDLWTHTMLPPVVGEALVIQATVPPYAAVHPTMPVVIRGYTLIQSRPKLKDGWPPKTRGRE